MLIFEVALPAFKLLSAETEIGSLSEASAQNRKHTYHKTQFTDYIQIVMKSNPEELLEPARRVFTKEGREPRSSKLEK